MSERHHKEEIEKILKELIEKYYGFEEISMDQLFYKIDGEVYHEEIHRGCGYATTGECVFKNLVLEMRRLAGLNTEYALYVGTRLNLYLDLDVEVASCITHGGSSLKPLAPLVPDLTWPITTPNAEIFKYVFDKDPLTQVFDYTTEKLLSSSHLYICPEIYYVLISGQYGDLSFLCMASAKRGVVTYCTTFGNYIYKVVSGEWELLVKELRPIRKRIDMKLVNYNNQLKSLPKEERKKYCDVYAIKDLVSKEIEEVDRLTKRYGIVRITIPLD